MAHSPIARINNDHGSAGLIAAVHIDVIRVSPKRAYNMAGQDYSAADYYGIVVRVRTEDGVEGVAEVFMTPGWYGADTPPSYFFLVKNLFGPALIGESVFDTAKLTHKMDSLWALGNNWTKAVVEIALYDAAAKTLNRPVVDLLGGRVRDRFPLVGGIGTEDPETMAQIAREYVERGFKTIKLKIGSPDTPALDVDRVRVVREEVGPDILIRLDANGVYDVRSAIKVIRQMERYDLDHIEQPVPDWNIKGMARIRDAIDTPLMADESVHTARDALNVIKAEAADVIKLKIAKCGGFAKCRDIVAICENEGVDVVLGNGIGTSAAALPELALACATPAIQPAGEFPGPDKLSADILLEPMIIEGGDAILPTAPGIGSALDYDAFNDCLFDHKTFLGINEK